MKIVMQTIPHQEQRYDTCGDWWFDEQNNLQIRVSELGNDDYNLLVGIHEIVEAILCQKDGVKEEDVTTFDKAFEAKNEGYFDEPGNDPAAPYYSQHLAATRIEMRLAGVLGVDWQEYEKAIYSLDYTAKPAG